MWFLSCEKKRSQSYSFKCVICTIKIKKVITITVNMLISKSGYSLRHNHSDVHCMRAIDTRWTVDLLLRSIPIHSN